MNKLVYFSIFIILIFFQFNLVYSCDPEIESCPFDFSNNNPQAFSDSNIYSNPQIYSDPNFWKNIPIEQIHNIPADKFDPTKLSPEKLNSATEAQIVANIDKFTNLRDANPIEVAKVFSKEPFVANIDISSATNVKFDSTTGKLIGDFPSYDPKQYPKDKFNQIIVGDIVKIIPINQKTGSIDIKNEVTITGAQSFNRNEDGSISIEVTSSKEVLVTGNQKGNIVLANGRTLEFENRGQFSVDTNGNFKGFDASLKIKEGDKIIQSIQGNFEKNGDLVLLKPYKNKHSIFEDLEYNIKIKTTDVNPGDLAIGKKGIKEPNGNYVIYGKETIYAKGQFELFQNDLRVSSKNKNSEYFSEKQMVNAKGILEIEDKSIKYKGLDETTTFKRKIDIKNELIEIDSKKAGKIAELSKKLILGTLLFEKGYIGNSVELKSVIEKKENGQISFKLDQKSLGIIASLEKDNKMFFKNDKNLILKLGEEVKFVISETNGFLYENSKGKVVGLSPDKVKTITGNTLIDINEELKSLNQKIKTASSEEVLGLMKKKDSLEFLVLNNNIQGLIKTSNFESAIKKTEDFLKLHPNSPIEGDIKLGLAELYIAKANSFSLEKPKDGILTLGGENSPLKYKTTIINGKETVIAWSADGENWMDLKTTQVKGGKWDGEKPREINLELINRLASSEGNLDVLKKEASTRQAQLSGEHASQKNLIEVQNTYANAIKLYSELKQNPQYSESASLGLASTQLQAGKLEEAKTEYYSLLQSTADSETKSKVYVGLSSYYLNKGDTSLALAALGNSLENNPNNEIAKLYKNRLDAAILDSVSKSLGNENQEMNKLFLTKLGDGTIYGMGIGKAALLLAGHYDNIDKIKDYEQQQLANQQAGIDYLKLLNSKGYSLTDIAKKTTNPGVDEIAKILNLPITSTNPEEKKQAIDTAIKIKIGIQAAFENPDVKNLLNNGRNGQFKFVTGEGYVDKSFLSTDWKDSILDGVNMQNVAMFLGPGATYKGTSVIGYLGKGVETTSKLIFGEEKIRKIGQSTSSIINTIGSSKIGEFLSKEYSVSNSFMDKSIQFTGRIAGTELGEEAIGSGVGAVVGVVKPEWATTASLITEISTGHSGILDKAFDSIGTGGKQVLRTNNQFLFDSNGEILAKQVGSFDTKEAREAFLKSIQTETKSFSNLGNGVFEIDGKRYYAGLEGYNFPTKVAEKEVVGSAVINPEDVIATQSGFLDKIKGMFDNKKLSPEFNSKDIASVQSFDDLRAYVKAQAKLYGDIQGNSQVFDVNSVLKQIDAVEHGKAPIETLTRSLGIRTKTSDLLNNQEMTSHISKTSYTQQEVYDRLKTTNDQDLFVTEGTIINPSVPMVILPKGKAEGMTIDFEYDTALRTTYDFEILPKADEILDKYVQKVKSGELSSKDAMAQAETEILDSVHNYVSRNVPYSGKYGEALPANSQIILLGESCLGVGGVCRHQGALSSALVAKLAQDGRLKGSATYNTGPGHGWGEYLKVSEDGKMDRYIMDSAQAHNGWLSTLESTKEGKHYGAIFKRDSGGEIVYETDVLGNFKLDKDGKRIPVSLLKEFNYRDAQPWTTGIQIHNQYYNSGVVN